MAVCILGGGSDLARLEALVRPLKFSFLLTEDEVCCAITQHPPKTIVSSHLDSNPRKVPNMGGFYMKHIMTYLHAMRTPINKLISIAIHLTNIG